MVRKDSKKEKELKHQARKRSISEGIFASMKMSFGDNYIAPFAIAINASNSMVALLTSIIGLLGPISQTFGSRLIEKNSRKKIIRKYIFLEALMWLSFVALAILSYKEIIPSLLPFLLLIFFSVYVIIHHVGIPAWFSWMGDIVDDKHRGRWFSKRSLLIGFTSVVLTISAAFFLDYFTKKGWIMLGFMILFSLAFLTRIKCWKLFEKQYEPKMEIKKGDYFSFWDFVLNARKNNFGRFAIFRAFLAFATTISGSLLAVYLLRHLNFTYTTYMMVILSGTVFSLFVIELWGKFSDRYGNYKTIILTSIVIPIIPILWILSPSPIYLILVPSGIGGIVWSGFNLATTNMIYDNVSKPKRGLAVSYYSLLNGIGIFLGAGLAALLIKFLELKTIEPLVAIFFFSAFVRMAVTFWWLPKIKEVRKTKKFTTHRAFKYIVLKEARPTLAEEVHQIMSIKKYLEE